VLAQPRHGRLWDELSARKSENKIYAKAHKFLASALSQADYLPPFEFFAHILAKGARKQIVSRFGAEADDAIGEFLSLAQRYENSYPHSLEGFLDWLSRVAGVINRDMEQDGGSVRVMTVHGAKGLEANVVIVPDTAQTPDKEQHAGILYTDDCVFFGAPKPDETTPITEAKAQAKLREMHEYRRLLYVALTRARNWLILCGYETKRGIHKNAWFPYLQAAAQRIGKEETNEEGEKIFALGAELSTKPSSQVSDATKISTAPLPLFLSAPPSEILTQRRILRPSDAFEDRLGTDEPAPLSPLADISGKKFRHGLLIHALLTMLPNIPQDERAGAGRHYLASRGVGNEATGQILDEVFAVLNHPEFSSLFGDKSRGEVMITAELRELGNGIHINGQIDRLALSDDEVMIADFKTNRSPPKSAEKIPNLYRAQMALYRAAMAKIYPERNIACVLIWTDGACAIRLPDSLLDDALEKICAQQTRKNLA
jgi:ATP-dependent helicase/nuclease subunit A